MGIGGEKSTKEIIFHATDIAEGKKTQKIQKKNINKITFENVSSEVNVKL